MATRQRGTLGILGAFFGLFIGGGAAGTGLASLLAPGSVWAEAVGLFAFPLAFVFGMQAWFGLALLSVVPRLLGFWRSRPAPLYPSVPGSIAFVPIASAHGAVAGLVSGWLSSAYPFWVVAPAYWLAGTLYGVLAWRLARAGFLMPPESI